MPNYEPLPLSLSFQTCSQLWFILFDPCYTYTFSATFRLYQETKINRRMLKKSCLDVIAPVMAIHSGNNGLHYFIFFFILICLFFLLVQWCHQYFMTCVFHFTVLRFVFLNLDNVELVLDCHGIQWKANLGTSPGQGIAYYDYIIFLFFFSVKVSIVSCS